jgi:uncharacterized protein
MAQARSDSVTPREVMLSWLFVIASVVVLVRINITLPGIGHLGSALIAVLFLYVPTYVAWRHSQDLVDYGFVSQPLRRGVIMASLAMLLAFPLFVGAYIAFYEVACKSSLLHSFVPHGMCVRYGGIASLHAPALNFKLLEFCAVQLVVVALPEELFFRGFILGVLEKRWPPKLRIAGGGIGWALVMSAAMFALIHLPKDGDPRALATFFPGLLFGWMRSATGSILPSTLTHAGSNILVKMLEGSLMR